MSKGGAIRWTPEQLAEFNKRCRKPAAPEPVAEGRIAYDLTMTGKTPAAAPAPTGKEKLQALGRLRDGSMNKTEARYAAHLDLLKHQGVILWYEFEGIKLRLADRTYYTPDFFVMRADGQLEAHEVKGFMMDDANVKVKVAGEMYPFRFIIVRLIKGSFTFTEVGNVSKGEGSKEQD